MLSSKLTATVLYAAPSFGHLIGTYKRKLNYLCSFECNVKEVCADIIFDKIIETRNKIEDLKHLRSAVNVALNLLKPKQREVIIMFYFKGMERSKIASALNVSESVVASRKHAGFTKLRTHIEMLGFKEDKIVSSFDNEALFIECIEKVEALTLKSRNFSGGSYAREG
ncbi:MAG: sigma-70 family RNA polymerase sigma factor [Clostridia bacterium]|nr:sigma-70 family RNA polymerase sigma factor [Clostridia bacterium]